MDLVASCKDKLTHFRIKELKDVLTQLGLSKQGKKQDLVDRILCIVADDQVSRMWSKKNTGKEVVARLLDDIYRKMQVSGAKDLASKGPVVSETSNVKINGEFEDPYRPDVHVRCPCGSSLETDSMIRCEDPRCHVWQHMNCVLIPEKPMEGNHLPIPEVFYCELCRLSRADPFWVTVANPLNPVKLTISNIPTEGGNPIQSVERTFQLTRADKDLLAKREYDVQAWCMLLNDKVPFRMQWPLYADLQINGVPARVINRPGSQMLGANGRDDGPIVTPFTKDGTNKISLTGCDARIFCIGVRIVKRRTVQQILNLIPVETEGETFEDALARVCRCVGGGGATEADSDSDIEVVADSITVNLRCPMSGSRMKIAGRFKPCAHMGCFDLDVFVEMNQRSRKWQCPICLKNYSLENVIIDPYFNRITSMTRHCGEDVTELDVKPDGSWRLKTKSESERREAGDLCQWHLPDGMLCIIRDDENIEPKPEIKKHIKQEGGSDGHSGGLKLRIRQDPGGLWKVSKPGGTNSPSCNNGLNDALGSHEPKVIPMSSSATGSGRDGDDCSVNQDGGGTFDFSTNNNGIEFDSVSVLNVDPLFAGFAGQIPSAPVGDAEIIVLSDSDEEDDPSGIGFSLPHPSNGYKGNNQEEDLSDIGFSLPRHPVIADSFEDPILMNGSNSCLGLFNTNDDEFGGIPLWPLPQGSQAGPGFQLFSPDGDVSGSLVDMPHSSLRGPTMNGYNDSAMGPGRALLGDASVGPSDSHQLTDNLVDNPLAVAMGREDPSLQIFLPTRPSGTSIQSSMMPDQPDMSNGIHTEDYLSLRLGGGVSGGLGERTVANGFNPREHVPPPINDASLLLGMNDGISSRSDKATRHRSDLGSPFSFPRQKRSVRPRLYLSMDSDSS